MRTIHRVSNFASLILIAVLVTGCATQEAARPRWRTVSISDSRLVAEEPRPSEHITRMARWASMRAVEEEGDGMVAKNEVWTTIIDCRDPRDPKIGSYQGDEGVYPASVIKLCYLVTAWDQIYTRGLVLDEALRRDMHDMIVYSDNQATNRILDRITNTNFGPELQSEDLNSFQLKRQTAVRYLNELGFKGLWATNKTYDENVPLYGRDVQWLGNPKGDNYDRSNSMTTSDTARLLYLIHRHALVAPEACDRMLALLRRDETEPTFFSKIVPEGVTMYSKSGLTDLCRHDAAIFEYPDGGSIIIVCFSKTRNVKESQPRVIERVAELVFDELAKTPPEWDNATADATPGASIK